MSFNGWSISFDFYKLLIDLLPKGKTILELGSGQGTDELLKRWNVISIEHDPKFAMIKRKGKYKHKMIYAPIKFQNIEGFSDEIGWYDTNILNKELYHKKYNLILVDGPTGIFGRGGFLVNIRLFKDVPIVIDDLHIDKYKDMFMKLINYFQFEEYTIVDNISDKYFGYMKHK